jgi:hypothetical protein
MDSKEPRTDGKYLTLGIADRVLGVRMERVTAVFVVSDIERQHSTGSATLPSAIAVDHSIEAIIDMRSCLGLPPCADD